MKNKLKVKSEKLIVFKIFNYCLIFTIFYILFTALSCSPNKERIFKKDKILMDTLITITVVSDLKDTAEKAIDAAFSEIEYLEKLSNHYSPDSEITRINRNAGVSEVKVSDDILKLLEKALYVSENTEGAFDVTIGPVIALYDFNKKIRPDYGMIKKNLSLVNYRDIIINRDKSTVFLKKKGVLIDLGGIAKGYAADKAAETLKKQGIRSGLVAVAGDIKAFGLKPDGKPWKIGIRNPEAKDKEDDIMATVELEDMAISTSGDYERFFLFNGKRYHHLLNPKTGLSAQECRSVSIITKEGAFTDAFATGIFILGPEQGLKVLDKLGFEGMIIDSQGKSHLTQGIRKKIEFKRTVS
ncbi:MAG: FAD:protein FMN transferase [Nitrospira sp.]|nr:FAD:protein FMN transferase [Nitrospira sp.]